MSYIPTPVEQAVHTWLSALITQPDAPAAPIPIIYESQGGTRPRSTFLSLMMLPGDTAIGQASERTRADGVTELAHERMLDVRVTIYGATAGAIAQEVVARAELSTSAALAQSLGLAMQRVTGQRVPTVMSQITEDRWVLTTQAQYVATVEQVTPLVTSITPTVTLAGA